ncbi:MAG TPA: PilZ domain-containing protein [Methylomirabilota bacterium]|jgi:hypothetical protein
MRRPPALVKRKATRKRSKSKAERRIARRRPLVLPVELLAGDGDGRTLNLSESGVFFETDEEFSPNARISLSLVLPHVHPLPPIRMTANGRIVRVESRNGRFGIAVQFTGCRYDTADSAGAGEISVIPPGARTAVSRRRAHR